MADEQPDTSWLNEVLEDAATKREENPAMIPPTADTQENDFLNISEEEKTRRFKRGNAIILTIIIVQIIALGFVIWW